MMSDETFDEYLNRLHCSQTDFDSVARDKYDLEAKLYGALIGAKLLRQERADLTEQLAEAKDQRRDFPRVCHWSQDDDCGYWETSCGLAWQCSNDETPKENGMNYCPKCGAVLLEAEGE